MKHSIHVQVIHVYQYIIVKYFEVNYDGFPLVKCTYVLGLSGSSMKSQLILEIKEHTSTLDKLTKFTY